MRKLKKLFKSRRGTSFPLTVAVTLSILLILCGISEYMRLMIIAAGVRSAVQSAVIATVNENYNDVYQGAREGYSGAYQPSGSSWVACLDYGDIYSQLDILLGAKEVSHKHVKYTGSSVEYTLSGLTASIKNAPFAPSDPKVAQKFLADATVNLVVPVSFCGNLLPPMKICVETQAEYTPKH